ncbi:3'-5' exonuclease [Cerasicoccus frondis]|uniref:3'-5' exonuclease n=1 Tax=Cerasicoccus frondis TaxID=490090 RepID=UPI002852B0A4|nr:3'-5' exonuclease [Cerasicoccus frondis]
MHYLIIDLEATCCDRNSFPRHQMEIIEIGAVMADADGEPVSDFQTFIRPVRHPQLTRFCRDLTSITQAQVDAAPTFPEAARALREWANQWPDHEFCSWGAYDRKQLRQDADYHGVSMPVFATHRNLKEAFSTKLGVKKRFGMNQALDKLGLSLEGVHHRGIDDARNITRILRYIETGVAR